MSKVSRRQLLKLGVSSSAGLLLGLRMTGGVKGAPLESTVTEPTQLHTLVQITPDGRIVLFAQNPEMGQGVKTSLPMILAEELDVSFEDIIIKQADWLPGTDLQFSGGSLSIRLNYQAMREAGATARMMLMQAAAERWQVPLDSLETGNARIWEKAKTGDQSTGSSGPPGTGRDPGLSHDSGKNVSYGELATAAALLPLPVDVPLKNPGDFRIIGKSQGDVDKRLIITGQALFNMDFKLPGMLYAVVRRSPVSDGQVLSYDDETTLKIAGVRAVYLLSNEQHGGRILQANSPNFVSGIAVLADNTWAAMKGAEALQVKWRNPDSLDSTDSLYKRFHAGLNAEALQVRKDGDPEAQLNADSEAFEAVYQVPLLPHAPMEPMNCTAQYKDGKLEIWAPTQNPGDLARAVTQTLGISTEESSTAVTNTGKSSTGKSSEPVIVHVMRAGGAFGRRYYSDFAIDTALLARQSGHPVQTVWTREDDMRHGYFRPAGVHRIRASVDEKSRIVAWQHKLAGHSRAAYLERDDPPFDTELDPYTFPAGFIPNLLLEHVFIPSRIPLGQWRGIAASANIFVAGSAIDELAHRANEDPLAFLLRLVGDQDSVQITDRFNLDTARLRGVIRKVADAANWTEPLASGDKKARRGRGIAACYDQGSWVAEVAEVTISDGRLKVDRVIAAVDCGRVINPQGAAAQVEGAILDGLSTTLMGEITVRAGVVEQSNFNNYRLLRIDRAPLIEVHFIDSDNEPRGLGEPPLPPLAAAVCNAIFAASGQRIRRLPLNSVLKV